MFKGKVLVVILFVSICVYIGSALSFVSSSPHSLETRQTESTACNFLQFVAFVNTSRCYSVIVDDAFQMTQDERSPGALAEEYCTQSCAGNFIDFIENVWDCDMTTLKEVYRLTIISICSQSPVGRRCVTHSLNDTALMNCGSALNPSSPSCSDECREGIASLMVETGCCFSTQFARFSIGAPVFDTVLNTCGLQFPVPCPLDYDSGTGYTYSSMNMLLATVSAVLVLFFAG